HRQPPRRPHRRGAGGRDTPGHDGEKINPLVTLLLCPRGQNILEMCACGRDTPSHDDPGGRDHRPRLLILTTATAWRVSTVLSIYPPVRTMQDHGQAGDSHSGHSRGGPTCKSMIPCCPTTYCSAARSGPATVIVIIVSLMSILPN